MYIQTGEYAEFVVLSLARRIAKVLILLYSSTCIDLDIVYTKVRKLVKDCGK